MKKTIFNFLSILALTFTGSSQDNISMKVVKTGSSPLMETGDLTDYSSGHSLFTYNVTSANNYSFDIDVLNTTGTAKTWDLIRFNETDVPASWSSTVCAGSCSTTSPLNPFCYVPTSPFVVENLATGVINLHVTVISSGTGTYKLFLGSCAHYEDSIEIQINSSVGINEINLTPHFSIFPNPSEDILSIQMKNSEKGNLKIVDAIGNVIHEEEIISSSTINISEFKNGIYFVSIENDSQISSNQKLIVNH